MNNGQGRESTTPDSNASRNSSASAEPLPETRTGKDVLLADHPPPEDSPTLVVVDDKSSSAESTTNDEEKAFVIDFGIATVLQSARCATTDVTRTGEIFGTPQYMSPEQCVGDKPDERSDIYSFGCLMYETLTGRPPFRGVNPVQIIMQHLKNPPPEFESDIRKKKLAEQLELVTMKCLEKERQKRLPNFSAVKAELDRLASGTGQSSIRVYAKASFARRLCASLLDGFVMCVIYHVIASGSFYTEHVAPIIMPALSGPHVWATVGELVNSITSAVPPWIYGTAWPAAWVVTDYLQTSHRDPWLVLFPLIAILYYCIFECSPLRATPGKLYFGILVKPDNEERVSLIGASKRLLVKVIGFYTCFIAAIVASANRSFIPALAKNLIDPPTDQWTGTTVVCEQSGPGPDVRSSPGSVWFRFVLAFLASLVCFLVVTPPLSYICIGLLWVKLMYEDCQAFFVHKSKPPITKTIDDPGVIRAESLTVAQAYKYRRLTLIWLIVFAFFAWISKVSVVFAGFTLLPLIIYLGQYHARFKALSGKASLTSAPSWTTLFMRSFKEAKLQNRQGGAESSRRSDQETGGGG